MNRDESLRWLLGLNGASFEADGYVVEFKIEETDITPERPHGISYALVLRPREGGRPWLRFDNAHAVSHRGGRYVKTPAAYDHWHRDERDPGRPYAFTDAATLLEDFWAEVDRILTEKGLLP